MVDDILLLINIHIHIKLFSHKNEATEGNKLFKTLKSYLVTIVLEKGTSQGVVSDYYNNDNLYHKFYDIEHLYHLWILAFDIYVKMQ